MVKPRIAISITMPLAINITCFLFIIQHFCCKNTNNSQLFRIFAQNFMKIMNYKALLSIICVSLLTVSCGKKKQHDDIIVQQVETPKPLAPIRMQDYRDVKDILWLGKQYQVEVSRIANDSLPMVKDELGQQFVDNRITLRIIRSDGSVFCTKTFTKAAFDKCLNDDYRKTGILEGFVFDKVDGSQLLFAASVCHPQTDEYIPMIVSVSNFGDVDIRLDGSMDTTGEDKAEI